MLLVLVCGQSSKMADSEKAEQSEDSSQNDTSCRTQCVSKNKINFIVSSGIKLIFRYQIHILQIQWTKPFLGVLIAGVSSIGICSVSAMVKKLVR